MDVSPEAVLVGAGLAASSLLWWLLRGRTEAANIVDPSLYTSPVAKISKLYVYPVKSCHRIEVTSSECYKRGLLHDRTWVIIAKDGRFCSQSWLPSMAKIKPSLKPLPAGVQLTLSAPGMDDIIVPQPDYNTPSTQVKVWRMSGEGKDVGDAVAHWVSQFLELEGCRMYYMAAGNQPRRLRTDSKWQEYSSPEDEASFSNWSPILVASEESLELLNSKVDTALVMERFRANIIVSGCLSHSEDTWKFIRLGDNVVMRGTKPCGRCKITKVDPEKGVPTGEEPIATLNKYRLHNEVYECEPDPRFSQSPLFGHHFVPISFGNLSVGDTIYTRPPEL